MTPTTTRPSCSRSPARSGSTCLAAVTGHDVLEDLERHGLLTVRYSGRRAGLSLAHPLFAEVLLRQLPALRGRRLRGELAEALEAVGARRRDDRVRLVAWRLDAGGAVDREDVLHAARLALLEGDDAIAERLVRRAAAAGGGARAMELLAEVHFRRNEPERLEAVLAGIDLDELPEADRVRVVRRRSSNRFYALTDADGTLAVLDETAHLFSAPWAVHALAAQRATVLSMAGRVDDALCCTEPLLDNDDPRLRFEVLRSRSLALAAAGRGEEALVLIDEAFDIHDRFDRDLSRPGRSILLFNRIFSLTELGRLDEARAAGAAAAAGDVVGGRVSWLAFARPRVELLAGQAAVALELSEAYALEARARGVFGAERWVLSLVGMARLLSGDSHGGYRDLDRVAELWPEEGYGGLFRSDRDRALGWLAMERSGAGVAHEVLLRGARLAAERGAYALEAMLRHDVVRFGGAAAVVDRLVELASSTQGPLAAARADHAAGVVAVDAFRLRSAVAAFEQIGSPLLAAEAALDLADAATATGDDAGADVARDRATRLLAQLDGVVATPRISRRHEEAILGALEHRLGDERVHAAPCCLGPVRPAVTDRRGDRRDQGLADEGVVRGVEPLTLVTQTEHPGLGEEAVKIVGRGDEREELIDERAPSRDHIVGEEPTGRGVSLEEVVVEAAGTLVVGLLGEGRRPPDRLELLGGHRSGPRSRSSRQTRAVPWRATTPSARVIVVRNS